MSTKHKALTAPEEYLALERKSETKSEYYAGEMFALAGAGLRHNLIAGNVLAALHIQLKGSDCQVYPSDLRLKVPQIPYYSYADVTVVCGQAQLEDEHADNLLNPIVIVEILSRSTERRDRTSKFESYRRIETLREYVLIAQDASKAEEYSKQPEGTWIFSETTDPCGTLKLNSIHCELSLSMFTPKVDF